MKNNPKKAAVIGCGFVGAATAFTLMQSKLFSELVLLDANHDKAVGEAEDIGHGIPFAGEMDIYAGDYDDIADCSIIIVTGPVQIRSQTKPVWIWFKKMLPFIRASFRRLPSGTMKAFC